MPGRTATLGVGWEMEEWGPERLASCTISLWSCNKGYMKCLGGCSLFKGDRELDQNFDLHKAPSA